MPAAEPRRTAMLSPGPATPVMPTLPPDESMREPLPAISTPRWFPPLIRPAALPVTVTLPVPPAPICAPLSTETPMP